MDYENEEWKGIKGFEGLYSVSTMGRVKSIGRVVKCGKGGKGTRIMDDRILSGSEKDYKGKVKYKLVRLRKDGKYYSFPIHQLVAMAFLDHTPSGMIAVVDHINGNKHDNRLKNLQIVSHSENMERSWVQNSIVFQQLKKEIEELKEENAKLRAKLGMGIA